MEVERAELERRLGRLLQLVAAVEDRLGLDRSVPLDTVGRLCSPSPCAEPERELWLGSRRGWIMEIRALDQFLGGASLLPKDSRRAHAGPDIRRAHSGG